MRGSAAVRMLILAALLVAARHSVADVGAVEAVLPAPLTAFPVEIAEWRGMEGPAFAPEVIRTLGADDYLNRVYHTAGAAAGLYVAYYAAQRHGDAIHSPQHCLPGTGWEPVNRSRVLIETGARRFPANRYVVQRGAQQQLVLYWFQGRGRSVASEYTNKLYLLADALRSGRTNGALVRVLTPIDGAGPAAADRTALAFARAIYPHLAQWLP